MKAKIVYLVDFNYNDDIDNYGFNVGIFTSFKNAKSAIIEELTDADDVIIDTCEEVTKNNRRYWTFTTNKGKYNIMEYALNTKWLCPIEKEYIEED